MSVWIRTQDKERLVKIESIQLSGRKLKGLSPLHPMGITLGKYESEESAASAMENIQGSIKKATGCNILVEMPAY